MSISERNGTTPDFTRSNEHISRLLEHMNKLSDLEALVSLASWDQNTILPDGAGEVRGAQLATVEGILHQVKVDPDLGKTIDGLRESVHGNSFTDADRGLVREAARLYDHAVKLPQTLVEEMARVSAGSFEAWRRAREHNDFTSFAPWLKKTVALQREYADRIGHRGHRYDVLLDIYEPGMTSERVEGLFAEVKSASIALLKRIQASGKTIDASCLEGDFASDKQRALADKVLTAMGYDFQRGYSAVSPHPFTSSFGSPFDVRVTVNPDPHFIQACLMAAIHEGGHALYEQGCSPLLARTPLASGASLGAHESQSRLWENSIGRSEAFWKGQFHLVQEVFPQEYRGKDSEVFTRALNRVSPSLIRIEADEVTYNLHILIRFELEKALIDGDLSIESLPAAWNAKYQEYLGITPGTDSKGVLQDVHWSSGFGYFPTYTLGNLYAAQIYEALRRDFSNFDERLAQGEISFILDWLRQRMYGAGVTYLPGDLMKRVTGEEISSTHFERYLTRKFEQIYSL